MIAKRTLHADGTTEMIMREIDETVRGVAIGRRLITNFVVAEFFLIVGNLVVRMCDRGGILPTWSMALIALATAIPMLLFAVSFFRMLRADLDEMLQREARGGFSLRFSSNTGRLERARG